MILLILILNILCQIHTVNIKIVLCFWCFCRVLSSICTCSLTLLNRSLNELNVSGNELYAFPCGVMQLSLKKLAVKDNYMHPLLWQHLIRYNPQVGWSISFPISYSMICCLLCFPLFSAKASFSSWCTDFHAYFSGKLHLTSDFLNTITKFKYKYFLYGYFTSRAFVIWQLSVFLKWDSTEKKDVSNCRLRFAICWLRYFFIVLIFQKTTTKTDELF